MAKQADICVGQIWVAKVSQKLTEVRILEIGDKPGANFFTGHKRIRCKVMNLKTGRIVTMTAAKFRCLVSHSTIAAPKDVETAALDILRKMNS